MLLLEESGVLCARCPATVLVRYDVGDRVQYLVFTQRKRTHHSACRVVFVDSSVRAPWVNLASRNVSSISFCECVNLVPVFCRGCSSKLCGVFK